MGCFSYLCKKCGKAILSNSFSGQKVKLFLLKDGRVLEEMEGEYDSYGRVFTEDRKNSIKWKSMEWPDLVDFHYNRKNDDGFAAVHSKCYSGIIPVTISEDDPNQGWGDDFEYMVNEDDNINFD